MNFINNIEKETLIICNNNDKEIFLHRNKLINIKVMTLQEFINKYVFEYDEKTILYIMKKYNIKYEIANIYIKNLYYIEDIQYNIKKLDLLREMKSILEKENLLKINKNFQKYIKNIDIIVYNIRLGKYETNLLKNLDYKYIEKKNLEYKHKIKYFDTIEEEVEYIATKICHLIETGISPNNIKLANVDSSYQNTISRIFTLFGLKANITNKTPLSSYQYIKDFMLDYQTKNLEIAINNIDKTNPLYEKLINVINKYIQYNSKELILYKLKHTNITSEKYHNGIDIIDYLNYNAKDDEHIFMLGFNDGIIPNSYKDIDYITDNIKELVNLDTTKEKNIALREDIIKSIKNIKNLYITYKLKDTKKTYYPSSLCTLFEVEKGEINKSISYSEKYSKIKLTKSIDEYIKYGYESDTLKTLYNNFKTKYNSYDNKYTLINRVMDKLTLSYSKMQTYNKCAFRYYLSDVLKLDIFEENFSTVIGSMVHYIMEKCLSENSNDIEKYVNDFLGDRILSNKEKFFLQKYKENIKELLNQVHLEKEYMSFDNSLYEKKIDIDYGNNIKFTGIIDKILYKEENNKTYIALIDYKTGNDDISLNYLNYGLNIQLPIYLYLSNYLNLRNIVYSGFYLQKFNITEKDYRLIGYSNSDKDILSKIDNSYENSKIIKGMKTLKDGSFGAHTKVLSSEEIETIKNITKSKINEVINNIKNNKFDINPKVNNNKNIGCDYCQFKDICFVKKQDQINITEQDFREETSWDGQMSN